MVSSAGHASRTPRISQTKPAIIISLGFASVFLMVLTLFRAREVHHAQTEWDGYLAEQNRRRSIDAACYQKLLSFNNAFGPSHQRRPKLDDLARQFNAGKALNNDQLGNAIVVDPGTGGHATIELSPDQTVSIVEPGDRNRPPPSMPGQPNIAALVMSFIASIAFCFVLLYRFILISIAWHGCSRSERVRRSWKLFLLAMITMHLSWMGSKFFPGFEPFGDAQILGFELFFASPAIVFVIGSYLSKREADGVRRCLHCRYDLTGNISGTCPECGTMIDVIKPTIRA